MQYNNLINILLDEFPELSITYEKEKEFFEGLPHIVYEDIFVPYIIQMVNEKNNDQKLIKAFTLIEDMLNCSIIKVQEVAVVSVLEALITKRKELELMRGYFGDTTKKVVKELEVKYGWIN